MTGNWYYYAIQSSKSKVEKTHDQSQIQPQTPQNNSTIKTWACHRYHQICNISSVNQTLQAWCKIPDKRSKFPTKINYILHAVEQSKGCTELTTLTLPIINDWCPQGDHRRRKWTKEKGMKGGRGRESARVHGIHETTEHQYYQNLSLP